MKQQLAFPSQTLWRLGFPLLIIAVLALNLRPTLTSTGPLLNDIQLSVGLDLQGASLLTVLPMVCMGVFPLLLPWFGRRVTENIWMITGLSIIALANFWRYWLADSASLISSALIGGAGIAIVQAIAPGVVKRWYPKKVPLVMGVYSASLMAGGGLAAMLSPLVAHHFDHWQLGVSIWGIPAVLAILLWRLRPKEGLSVNHESKVINFFVNRRAWLLAGYFGLVNGGYACMIAWLPSFAQGLGWSAQKSGELIGLMTVFQVIAALVVPTLSGEKLDRRPWLLCALGIQLVGLCGLVFAANLALMLWVALIGAGLGACFALTLTVALDHTPLPKLAGVLTAFVQGVGFIITAIIPYVAGWLRQLTGGFEWSWVMLIMILMLMLVVTFRFSPVGYNKAICMT